MLPLHTHFHAQSHQQYCFVALEFVSHLIKVSIIILHKHIFSSTRQRVWYVVHAYIQWPDDIMVIKGIMSHLLRSNKSLLILIQSICMPCIIARMMFSPYRRFATVLLYIPTMHASASQIYIYSNNDTLQGLSSLYSLTPFMCLTLDSNIKSIQIKLLYIPACVCTCIHQFEACI